MAFILGFGVGLLFAAAVMTVWIYLHVPLPSRNSARREVSELERRTLQRLITAELLAREQLGADAADIKGTAVELRDRS